MEGRGGGGRGFQRGEQRTDATRGGAEGTAGPTGSGLTVLGEEGGL